MIILLQLYDGQIPEDVMITNTNPDTVDFEMDIYWVVTAGADPVAYMQKNIRTVFAWAM